MYKYNNILNFYNEYIKLEQVIRKGWLMREVPSARLESVADHTLQLIMLSSVVSNELNLDIDDKRLMEMLLIHDLGEIIIGDVSEIEENSELKKQNEEEAIKSIFNILSEETANYYYSLWHEMELRNTDLSKFAYSLDKIDAIIKAGIYEKEFSVDGLFKEFSVFQKQRGTFENSILKDFFDFVVVNFDK